jgi:predicted ATPase
LFDEKYIRKIMIDIPEEKKSIYPFLLDAVKNFPELSLKSKVSFFIGENGTGKSTLLEAIAVAYGFNAEGGSKHFNFASNDTHSILSEHIKLTKGIRIPKNGFFLRAESFYNAATYIDELDRDGTASKIIDSYGGISLHKQSHGESFMALVQNRFSGNGLFILDEPEAALSPTRQLALLARIHDLVSQGSQFMIATHSPILMAYPDAVIYDVASACEIVKLEDTEHYRVTREFMNNPEKMLAILFGSDEE